MLALADKPASTNTQGPIVKKPRRASKIANPAESDPGPMRMVRLSAGCGRLLGTIAPAAARVPSMMSVMEKRVLFNLARQRYAGEGVIIDAGTFLGASTAAFGMGLAANPRIAEIRARWGRPIVSFDRGIIQPGMPGFFRRNKITDAGEIGDSFLPLLEANIAPVADLVDLRIGDILETTHGLDYPVEILFLDIFKNPELCRHVLRQFLPKLIPGRSFVIQQDYFYEHLPFINVAQEFFGEYFNYVGEVCSSALFQCIRAIPPEAIAQFEAGLPGEEQIRLASIAMQRSCDPARRFMMALSKVRLIRQLFGNEVARAQLDYVKDDYPEQVISALPRLQEALLSLEQLCASDKEPVAVA